MFSKFVEVSNGYNWGKFLVCRFTAEEWRQRSKVDGGSLIGGRGWSHQHLWVLDMQTGEGAYFRPGGMASQDLDKHQIWVCPMYALFLDRLYENQDWCSDITKIPDLIELTDQESKKASALFGYRREGPDETERLRVIEETRIKPSKPARR